ncbi:polyphosphate--glucose phosphotransferase [Promineifilum sp.]|uniref:polyphosphate--glucose phosphotransferase n=1 Tax=Promineifilum sp. TaxID=2664178 RepID=UPI0035B10B3F
MELLGIDIGGSGIKGAIVNATTGELVTERLRLPSPPTFQPDEVVATVADLVKQFNYEGPIGVGFPAVVMHGRVMTPPTALAFPGWDDVNLAERISAATGHPTTVGNDADVACLAEMYFGAGKGQSGVVMVFTIGTGIGSALFLDGRIVPNFELGRVFLQDSKKTAEQWTSDRVREEKGLSWEEWGGRLNLYFKHIELLFWPDVIIIGGGVSKKHAKFFPYINVRAQLLPAAFRNEAGIVGAAMAALDVHEPQAWDLPGAGHSEGA